eukprot:806333_1
MLKHHPWRHFDPAYIPARFPTVPSMAFIEQLYGVPFPNALRLVWPAFPVSISLSGSVSNDSVLYDIASDLANDVIFKMHTIVGKRMKSMIKRLSPYAQPKHCYGFHAARFEYAIKFFGIRFNNLLDFGSHPGACAASALKYCKDVVCVSKKPKRDSKEVFCPYIARDSD